jgi:hypothetical protein
MYTFEVYCKETVLQEEIWKGMIKKILQHTSYFHQFSLEVRVSVSEITFFIHCEKDLSQFTNELHPFLLQKQEEAFPHPPANGKFCYVNFTDHEQIINLKEREELRMSRSLGRVYFYFYRLPFYDYTRLEFYFLSKIRQIYRCRRYFHEPPLSLLTIDFKKSIKFKLKSVPIYTKLQKLGAFFNEEKEQGMLEVLGFPYLSRKAYFPLQSFDYNKHSLILGQTGTGKSKFIELYIKELEKRGVTDEFTVVILDPHASLYTDFSMYPHQVNIDFVKTSCKLFAQIGEPKIATELTILLFRTLMKDQFNPKMERVLKYALFVLFGTNNMSLEKLKSFLTDVIARKEILLRPEVTPSLQQFFDTDFVEMETKYYEMSIMPILTLLDELTFLPISNFQDSASLQELIEQNNLVFLSLNQIVLGAKATKLIAGLLIQQLFLLAQSKKLNRKLLFIIDEVSVVQNDSLAAILSEARKFNLFLILTQQYLKQVDEIILNSMITNIYNYFLFKISEDDAKLLANNLEFDFPTEDLDSEWGDKGNKELDLKLRMMTTLNPRECLVRIYGNGKLQPVFKARTLDV